jgi:hypothetical protein
VSIVEKIHSSYMTYLCMFYHYILLFVLGTNRCPSDFLHYRHLNFCIFVALFQVLIGVHQIFSIIDTYISVYCFALFQELTSVHDTNGVIRIHKLIDWFLFVLNAIFSNISAISWRPVLVVEEAGVPGENHRPWEATGKLYHLRSRY